MIEHMPNKVHGYVKHDKHFLEAQTKKMREL